MKLYLVGNEDDDQDDKDEEENDLDKKMGDLGDGENEKLDDQIWGSDNEEEEEEEVWFLNGF
jgi:midasin